MSESAAARILRLTDSDARRLLLAGPCGVGKSHVADELVALRPGLRRIEHDRVKAAPDGMLSPCSKSLFDPELCFGALLPDDGEFVCDLGGNTVFFNGVDVKSRLDALRAFKETHRVYIVVLEAPESIVAGRFKQCRRPDNDDDVEELWREWIEVQRPAWESIADLWVDA